MTFSIRSTAVALAFPLLALTNACGTSPSEEYAATRIEALDANDGSAITVVRKKVGPFVSAEGTDSAGVHRAMLFRHGVFQGHETAPGIHRRTYIVSRFDIFAGDQRDVTVTTAFEPTSLITWMRVTQPSTGRAAMCGMDARASQRWKGVRMFRLFEAPGQAPIVEHAFWSFDAKTPPVACDPINWLTPAAAASFAYFGPLFAKYTEGVPRPSPLADLVITETNGGWSDADRERETAWHRKASATAAAASVAVLTAGMITAASMPNAGQGRFVLAVSAVGAVITYGVVEAASFAGYVADDELDKLKDGTTLDGGIDGPVPPEADGCEPDSGVYVTCPDLAPDGGGGGGGDGGIWPEDGWSRGGGNNSPEDPGNGDSNIGENGNRVGECNGYLTAGIHPTKWCP
jgi:hypothetical protein